MNCWSLRCSWSIACRRCFNYIFILHLTLGFIVLREGNCKQIWETFEYWDLVRLILEIYGTILQHPQAFCNGAAHANLRNSNENANSSLHRLICPGVDDNSLSGIALLARSMGLTWGPSGADRTQVGPMLAPWTLLTGCPRLSLVNDGLFFLWGFGFCLISYILCMKGLIPRGNG